MEQLQVFLRDLRNDVYKLLPMKEAELNGVDNHLEQYLSSMIDNLTGAQVTYPELAKEKLFLYTLNKLNFIHTTQVEFAKWRTVILDATKSIDTLYRSHGGK